MNLSSSSESKASLHFNDAITTSISANLDKSNVGEVEMLEQMYEVSKRQTQLLKNKLELEELKKSELIENNKSIV
jgi:hypothetical protein